MEIERKWLVSAENIPRNLEYTGSYLIEQAYVSFSPTIRIRRINCGEKHILTVKTHPENLEHIGLQREEYEIPLSAAEYSSLLGKTEGNVVHKRRHTFPVGNGLTGELDFFEGELAGLALLEIEFPDTESALAFPDPYWVEADVTYDDRYKNSALAQAGMP